TAARRAWRRLFGRELRDRVLGQDSRARPGLQLRWPARPGRSEEPRVLARLGIGLRSAPDAARLQVPEPEREKQLRLRRIGRDLERVGRAMDPFATLGLPRRYEIDMQELETRYRELQKALHPDKHAGASASQRRLSLERAIQVNEAYRVLKDDLKRAEALVAL